MVFAIQSWNGKEIDDPAPCARFLCTVLPVDRFAVQTVRRGNGMDFEKKNLTGGLLDTNRSGGGG